MGEVVQSLPQEVDGPMPPWKGATDAGHILRNEFPSFEEIDPMKERETPMETYGLSSRNHLAASLNTGAGWTEATRY